jgi:subtilisin family serine protease
MHHPLSAPFWTWLLRRRPGRSINRAHRPLLAVESLEDRLTLSTSPISPASQYDSWRQTRFTIDDATASLPSTVQAQSSGSTPTNASFGADINLSQALGTYPYRGNGYSVAVIDTGIDYNNPDLGGGWGNRVIGGWNFVNNTSNPMDDNGHGTNVAGIIGSTNATYSGVAPGVDFVALKVLDKTGSGTYGAVDDALKWVVAHQAQYHIVAVNMSLGSGDFASNPYTFLESDFTTLVQNGVFISVAAGNDYYGHSPGLAYPAISPNVVSVGAVWAGNFGPASWASGARDYSSAADQIVSFSQRSGALDILSPGAMITSDYLGNRLQTMAGTSMATPVITGAAVLLHQALDAINSPANEAQILQLMQATGASIADAAHGQDNVAHTGLTFKRIDLYAALSAVSSAPAPGGPPTLTPPAPLTIAAGTTGSEVLSGAAARGAALTYSAQLQTNGGQAYQLRQQLGLTYAGSYYLNSWAQNEEWLQGSGTSWYFILPTGNLYRWAGTMTDSLKPANQLASLSPSYYADPSLLWNAQPGGSPPVTVAVAGNVLYVATSPGYAGTFQVNVTASDGQQSTTQTVTVTVVLPQTPQLGAIAPVTIDGGQSSSVALPGISTDGAPIFYSVAILGSYATAPAVLGVAGNWLTIQPASSFSGGFDVQVVVSNGVYTATQQFHVTVNGITPLSIMSGDFNGDGRPDTVQFRSDGSWWVTLSNGSTNQWAQWSAAANWKAVMVGSFTGDGKTDVVGLSTDGSWWVGISTGSSFRTYLWAQWSPANRWNTLMAGDFNGDGKTDIIGFNNDGSWWVGQSTGGAFRTSMWTQWLRPAHWSFISAGDFNGDGKADIIGYNRDGTWWVGQSTGSRFTTADWATWSPAAYWNSVVVGDFNGDGKSDIGGFNNDGAWWVGLSGGSRFVTRQWTVWSPASTWAAITVGDVNGDGRLDVIGHSDDGTWWVGYSTGRGFSTNTWTPPSSQSARIDGLRATAAGSNSHWAAWLGLTDVAYPHHRPKPKPKPHALHR